MAELDSLKTELGTSSRTSTIKCLIQYYLESCKGTKKGEIPYVTSSVIRDSTPAIVAGPTGAGKTYAIKGR